MKTPSVRFGLIGFGAWGKCHAEAIRRTPGAELVAIAAKSDATCDAAREAFPDVAVGSDYRDLLARDDVDVVDVVLPSHLHHEVASAALKTGKHLLLEKPMCLSVAQCDDLIDLARKNDRWLAVGHELRLSSLWGKIKRMIDDGFIGEPKYVLVELSRKPYRLGAEGWRYDINRVGNWILEEPIHFFDLACWYLRGRTRGSSAVGEYSKSGQVAVSAGHDAADEPISVFAAASSHLPDHPELRHNFTAIVQFAGGPYAIVSQSLAMFEHHQTVKVAGTNGSLWASWSGAMDRTRHPSFFLKAGVGDAVRDVPIDKIAGELFELEDQIAMLVGAVRDGRPLATTGEDGKRAVALCVAAQQSLDSGNPVLMREVAQ